MKGWFDAFRDDGAPTLYSFSNRTPVTGDVSIVAVSVLFATLYIAFLVIFPGVRKQVSSSETFIHRDRHPSSSSPGKLIARFAVFYVIFSITKCVQSRPEKATKSKSSAEDDDEAERRLLKTFSSPRAGFVEMKMKFSLFFDCIKPPQLIETQLWYQLAPKSCLIFSFSRLLLQKFSTFITVTLSLFVGLVILGECCDLIDD